MQSKALSCRAGHRVRVQTRKSAVVVCARHGSDHAHASRREILSQGLVFLSTAEVAQLALGSAPAVAGPAEDAANLFKKDLNKSRRKKIPVEAYKDVEVPGGGPPLKVFEVKVGNGLEAVDGSRVAVHYELRWKGVTFQTSRQGMGVTGGSPLGFNIGAQPGLGGTLKGLDLAVRGMRVGGQRKALIPPEYGYGQKGYGEVPPNQVLELDVELLSIQTSPFGTPVKVVEG